MDYPLLKRGVWRAPWLGPNGEVVLVAITRAHHMCYPPVTVPRGADEAAANRALLAQLNREDPPLKAI